MLRCFSPSLFPGRNLVTAVGVFWDDVEENQPAETMNDALIHSRVAVYCCILNICKSAVFHKKTPHNLPSNIHIHIQTYLASFFN